MRRQLVVRHVVVAGAVGVVGAVGVAAQVARQSALFAGMQVLCRPAWRSARMHRWYVMG